MFWEKYNYTQIKSKVFEALSKNTNYRSENILGIPGTFLDTDIFYDDAAFLKEKRNLADKLRIAILYTNLLLAKQCVYRKVFLTSKL